MALAAVLLPSNSAAAQGITVNPVIVRMGQGEMAATLTLSNHEERSVAIQIRTFGWGQIDAVGEKLVPTEDLWASPPLATILPGANQVVRLVLRQPVQGREATYRILLDELPPPSEPQHVRVALRFSIPVFAEPRSRIAPHVGWRIVTRAGQLWLIAVNDGTRHQSFHDIALHLPDGRLLAVEFKTPPHILAGSTRHWHILTHGPLPAPNTPIRLVAGVESGSIEQMVRVDAPP